MEKIFVVANWKMNPKSLTDAKRLFETVKKEIRGIKNLELVFCPPFVFFPIIKKSSIFVKLGGQNCYFEHNGAFTGEVSPAMLKNLGCKYVILGHSERRVYFGESDEMINKKIRASLDADLMPIFCVGENKEERVSGKTKDVLETQLRIGLSGIARHWVRNIVFAYEPVWSISTFEGIPASPQDIESCGILIKKILTNIYDLKIIKDVLLFYGGSVNSRNALDFMEKSGMRGLLVGGASLNATEFINIIKSITGAKTNENA